MDDDKYKIFNWIQAEALFRLDRINLISKIELGINNSLSWYDNYPIVILEKGKKVFSKDYKFISLAPGYGTPSIRFYYKSNYNSDTIHHCFMLKKDAPKHWNLNVPWPNITTITL